MAKFTIKHPVMLRDAAREFGVQYMWLRRQILNGKIRAQKLGRYQFVEREDVEKIVPERQLLERLLAARKKGRA